jgi:predicted nucleic acid-binding Zn ribbon protein
MNHKHCEWCDHSFETKINYQIYCSAECREAATKEKIMQNYFLKQTKKRFLKKRACKSCGSLLSAYNVSQTCFGCADNPSDVSKALREMKGIINEDE